MEYRPMQYLQHAASATGTTSLSEGVQVGQPPACSTTKAALRRKPTTELASRLPPPHYASLPAIIRQSILRCWPIAAALRRAATFEAWRWAMNVRWAGVTLTS